MSVLRAVIVSWRNLIVAELQVGFVESRRARIADPITMPRLPEPFL